MKSILIIGLGRFGRHLCRKFMSLNNEVMIVDRDEAAVTALADEVTSAQIADCTDENALRALGVKNFDLCFVCIGSDFASSLLITSMLKDMGAARVVAKASQDIHAKLLLRNGADEVVYPERDSAERMATRLSAQNVFDYIELTDEYSIYEIACAVRLGGEDHPRGRCAQQIPHQHSGREGRRRAQAPAGRRLSVHRERASAGDGRPRGCEEAAAQDVTRFG